MINAIFNFDYLPYKLSLIFGDFIDVTGHFYTKTKYF